MAWFSWQGTSLRLELTVQPGARANEFRGLHGDTLRIRIQAPPTNGRANQALIEYLAEVFGVGRAQVRIAKGASARRKSLRIDAPAQIPDALHALGFANHRANP